MLSKKVAVRAAIGTIGGLVLASLSAVAVAEPDTRGDSGHQAVSQTTFGTPTVTEAASDEITQDVFNQIYDEVSTPYEYGMVLPKGEQIADFDSELTDQMNVFRIPGDDEYVYTTYVGKDVNRKTDGTDDTGYSTGLARSKDMLSWEKLGVILEPDKGFYSGSTAGYLVKEHQWGDLPTPHLTDDDKLALTVLATDENGYEQGNKRGGVAFSETDSFFDDNGDVSQFEMHPEPALDGSASYENGTIWAMKTIWDAESSRYVAFYNASHGPEVMNQAYSTDLINWDREESNPVLTPFEQPNGENWGTLYNGDADVVKIGDYWVMFYFTDTPVKIGDKIKPNNVIDSFAVSKDMVNWHKSDYQLTSKNSTYARSYAHKPAVVKKNGVVYHYYNAVAYQERGMALATSVDLSPLREAKYVLENRNDAALAGLLSATQKELVRNGGSLADVHDALTELRLYLHPEADSTLMNATVSFSIDGAARESALIASSPSTAAAPEEPAAYAATIPNAATNVRLFVTPTSPSASVSIGGEIVSPSAGTGIDFDPVHGAETQHVTVTSRDGTSETAFAMTIASDAAEADPEVAVAAGSRCLAGNAYLTVSVTNSDDEAVDVEVTSPHGIASFDALPAGATRSAALNSRADAFDAGAVDVIATAGEDSTAVSAEYEAASCG